MSQKFSDTEVKNIGTILSDGKFKVPFSQRNYSWHTDKKDDQVGRLWSDLLSNFGIYRRNEERINELSEKENDSSLSSEEREHARVQKDGLKLSGIGEYFLGPMVFVKTDLNRYHGRYAIVDGQQRLTTITMVFCIIRDFMIKYSIQLENNPKTQLPNGFNDYAEFIENRITDTESGEKIHEEDGWRLELNSVDKEIFEKVILAYKTSEHDGVPDKFEEEDRTTRPVQGTNPTMWREYLDIDKKVIWMEEQLRRKNLVESNTKLLEAYIRLKKNIFNALVTDFVPESAERDEKIAEIERNAEIEADEDMRISPGHHGLHQYFFDGFYGLDKLQDKSWDTSDETLLKAKMRDEYNGKKDFPEWIEKVLLPKVLKTETGIARSGKIPFEKYREGLIEKKKRDANEQAAVRNLGRLAAFANNVLAKSMYNVRVRVNSMTDAFQIFETLNNTGEPLTTANLIKNLVLEELGISDDNELQKYADRWDKIIKSCKKTKPNDFIRESLRSRGIEDNGTFVFNNYKLPQYSFPVKVEENNLFKIIESQIKGSDAAKKYLKELEQDIELVKQLDDPSVANFDDLKKPLYSLLDIEGKYVRIPILTAWRKWGQPPDTENVIENNTNELLVLTKFLVLWFWKYKTIRNQSATNVDGWMTKCCEIIQNTNDSLIALNTIIKFLLQWTDPIQFRSRFWEKSIDIQDGLAKHILYHITEWLGGDNPDVVPVRNLELEHILPKKPLEDNSTEAWDKPAFFQNYEHDNQELIDLQQEYDFPKDQMYIEKSWDKWKSRLGNLTILNKKINGKIQNKNYVTKRDYTEGTTDMGYNASDLRINKFTVMKKQDEDEDDKNLWTDRTDWTALDILARTEYFVRISEDVFRLPFLICGKQSCSSRDPETRPITITGSWDEINDAPCPHCGENDVQIWWPKNNSPAYRVSNTQQCPHDITF